ncbi:MAG: Creatinine amidohydrolase [Candidatus Tokpelaia hoelldobleri]|uniref:Creatinine amidohydrolase n=1 Tax=Candidatus Tokpelaia hoelldobleri TaxID=1902579 RepID=A0A1U9JTI0_9HYPH|nr:MAG: Creatinine amidohydrolase [Candidatus Tokpelaia hoelldoblerii]
MSSDPIVVLPLGAHEYHGPHLPLDTDTQIARAVAQRAAAKLPADSAVRFLETEPAGYSVEHMHHKGTRTLTYEEAIARWIAIGKKQHDKGVRKFVMLNAHGGNSPLMTIVATELRYRFNMLAVATSWGRFGLPEGLIPPEQQALDIHAGFIETSVMLAIAPETVNMQKAADFHNAQADMAQKFTWLRAYGKHAFGWIMDDLNSQGAAGDARHANAGAGEKILDHAANGFVQLLTDIHHFDVKCLV